MCIGNSVPVICGVTSNETEFYGQSNIITLVTGSTCYSQWNTQENKQKHKIQNQMTSRECNSAT